MALGQTLAGLAPIAGAGIGTFAGGPVGALIGQGIGQVGGNLLQDYFKQNSPAEQARSQLMQQLQGQAPYQRTDFNPIAQEEMRRFNRETVPGISNQFAGLGGLNSSGFRQSLSGAGQDLQTRLAALRANHEMTQNQFATGAEERRRQMLGGLAGGIAGEEQGQQMNRMNQFGNIAGQIPGQLMDVARYRQTGQNQSLSQILNALTSQQSQQNNTFNQAGQLGNQALGQSFENVLRQNPTQAAQIMKNIFDALNASAQVGGTFVGAALGA